MQAGKLRHRVTIKKHGGVPPALSYPDSHGQKHVNWTNHATVWASVEPLSGRELLRAQEVESAVTHRVRMRYTSGVTPDMRIALSTRRFNILSIRNRDERNVELELMCVEIAATQ